VISYHTLENSDPARGALLWRAPELLASDLHTNTPAADMWSAGLILYEMATGCIAYYDSRGTAVWPTAKAAAAAPAPAPVSDWQARVVAGRSPEEVLPLPGSTHPALAAVIHACLRLDPSARMQADTAFTALCAAMPSVEVRERYGGGRAAAPAQSSFVAGTAATAASGSHGFSHAHAKAMPTVSGERVTLPLAMC
jgi:serine/threonine protein kinase